MQFDIFFSISQTPVDGMMPSEKEMFVHFFDQVEAADSLGYKTAWLAESHYSTESQKAHKKAVVPHWIGEIGLNVDFLQLSQRIFQRTRRIETGSAVMNILCNGGPLAAAERIAAFLTYHGLDEKESRRIHVGFAAGRFDFINRTTGILPRDPVEEVAWPALKGKMFREAAEIFVRALEGETLHSDQIEKGTLTRGDFRSDEDWERTQAAAEQHDPHLGPRPDSIPIRPRFPFEATQIIPKDFRRELLNLVIGSHEPSVQDRVNQFAPVRVFNLSITPSQQIEETHQRMGENYHPRGGPWQRSYMPRTTLVFLNEEEGLDDATKASRAKEEAVSALGAYWSALEGTIDSKRIDNASENALVGNATQVAQQIKERFHPDDALMLWFDFFNHDSDRVIRNMRAFQEKVVPRLND